MGAVGEVWRKFAGSEETLEEEESLVSGVDFESNNLNFASISPWAKKPESLRKEEFI